MSDEMLERHIRQYIEAQTVDEVVFSWQGGEPTLLGLGFFEKVVAFEHTGDVFTCDHYVYPEYKIGNIADTHWSEMAYGETAQKFGFAKRDLLPDFCRRCEFLKLCWGECPKNRLVRTPDGEPGLNYLCSGLKQFYAHIQRDMPEILRRVQAQKG